MPIYEFYCSGCHTLFNFLSRTPNTSKRPSCPRCGQRRLQRRVSAFAISKGRPEPVAGEDALAGMDEEKLERAMTELASEAEGMNEDDPRQMGRLMRRLFDSSGLPLGQGMDEAIRRLEAGEDPEAIEAEMGDLLEGEEALIGEAEGSPGRRLRARLKPPSVDPTLHEL